MINREQAREMIMQIRNECDIHGACTPDCPFFFSHTRWCIFDGQPYDWPVEDNDVIEYSAERFRDICEHIAADVFDQVEKKITERTDQEEEGEQ